MFKKPESNFFRTSDNEQIFYTKNFAEVDLARPVLIFNYGLVCSNHHWKFQLGHFDDLGYQILIHDYRGHYQSTGKDNLSSMTFPRMAQDIAELSYFLGIQKAVMLGHSMGVNISLQLAKDHPDLVSSMVLISGTFMPVKDVMFDSNIMDFITPLLDAGMHKYPKVFDKVFATSGMNPLIKTIIHTTGFNKARVSKDFIEIYLNRVGQLGPEVFFQLFNEMTKQNIVSSLRKMKSPALVIGGIKDNVIPNHLQRTLAELMPHAETYFLKEGSHVPQADYPDYINERLEVFIRQHSATA
jgi:pimeloyl-ACP methyl ester carboxylesterase